MAARRLPRSPSEEGCSSREFGWVLLVFPLASPISSISSSQYSPHVRQRVASPLLATLCGEPPAICSLQRPVATPSVNLAHRLAQKLASAIACLLGIARWALSSGSGLPERSSSFAVLRASPSEVVPLSQSGVDCQREACCRARPWPRKGLSRASLCGEIIVFGPQPLRPSEQHMWPLWCRYDRLLFHRERPHDMGRGH